MRLQSELPGWTRRVDDDLRLLGLGRGQILHGVDAWRIAHRTRITHDAYDMSRDVTDAHIQTALQRIFPRCVFKDPKRY